MLLVSNISGTKRNSHLSLWLVMTTRAGAIHAPNSQRAATAAQTGLGGPRISSASGVEVTFPHELQERERQASALKGLPCRSACGAELTHWPPGASRHCTSPPAQPALHRHCPLRGTRPRQRSQEPTHSPLTSGDPHRPLGEPCAVNFFPF